MAQSVESEPDCGPLVGLAQVRTVFVDEEIHEAEVDAQLAEANETTELHGNK